MLSRLKYFAKIDKDKAALEKARNELESFVFDAQDKLTSQKMYVDCSTDTERAAILRQLSEASDWLYEQTDVVDSKVSAERHVKHLHQSFPADLTAACIVVSIALRFLSDVDYW